MNTNKAKTYVKICGITSVDQARQIAELGVDAIGIISVKDSPRYVSRQIKRKIFQYLKQFFPDIKRVSVIKNIPLGTLKQNLINSDYENVIQLHGDEDENYCRDFKKNIDNIELWKAFRIKTKESIRQILSYESFIDAILLDSWSRDTYGGSGKRIEKGYLKDLKFNKSWFLAGGISIDWAKQIIEEIKPDGVDISSSIEVSPGIKDIEKTKRLLEEIKR